MADKPALWEGRLVDRQTASAPQSRVLGVVVPPEGRRGAVLLVGAGGSASSGVPTSSVLVIRAAERSYCLAEGRDPKDPTVRRSDWLPWLRRQSWYDDRRPIEENYSIVIEHGLSPKAERRRFLKEVMHPDVPAGPGIQDLGELIVRGAIRTVLTPNFDPVLVDHLHGDRRLHSLDVISAPSDFDRIASDPDDPQVIYLHGSPDDYSDQNLIDEVEHLNPQLLQALLPVMREHALVVVGYKGAEPSIMRDLLQDRATLGFRQGLYWCAKATTIRGGLHPLVRELAGAIDGNFHLVEITNFDDLMAACRAEAERRGSAAARGAAGVSAPSPELTLVAGSSEAMLNWDRARDRLTAYCARVEIAVPALVDRRWMIERLSEQRMCRQESDGLRLSLAAVLLFGIEPQKSIEHARVIVKETGEADREFTGDLWQQLDDVLETLEEVNQPYQLKGAVTETVRPYPPLALKEVVVNGLVHRDYSRQEPAVIQIDDDFIRISSPGGLLPELRDRLGDAPDERLARADTRGLKAYRNPAIADLMYGAGKMEKEGTGISDVRRWVEANNGRVSFAVDDRSQSFVATIWRRPDAVDAQTRTAAPVAIARFVTNLLEVESLPESVWSAPTAWRSRGELGRSHPTFEHLPAFVISGGRLLTFCPLSDAATPFRADFAAGGAQPRERRQLEQDPDEHRLLVQLLNQCLYGHFRSIGLMVDMRKKRAYFPRGESGPVEVTYQARLRRASRTVTKPNVSPTTQLVRYWEHQSFEFGFEQFGSTWALQIVPGYVFTIDGRRQFLEGTRVTRLATQRASRDYNPQVHNDLFFWTAVLSRGTRSFELDAGGGQLVRVRAALVPAETRRDTGLPGEEDVMAIESGLDEPPGRSATELEDEIADLAAEQQQEDQADES